MGFMFFTGLFVPCFYQATGRTEMVRCLVWLRLSRARKIMAFFKRMEKDIRISYLFTRIVKLITVELYFTHTAACVFYYLATTLPPASEAGTWVGSLTLGDARYINFREIDLLTRYVTSLYFAIVTMATVGTTMPCSALDPSIDHLGVHHVDQQTNLCSFVLIVQRHIQVTATSMR